VKEKVDEDDAFLISMIDKAKEEGKRAGYAMQGGQSVLKVDRKLFNFQRELNSLFSKLQVDTKEEEEEKKGDNGLEELYEGASKRQKRQMKQMEKKMAQKQVGTAGTKRFFLVQPKPNWPRDPKMLRMERRAPASDREEESKGGLRFTFVKEPEYVALQKEFEKIQERGDINAIAQWSQRNFYHHESLLVIADFLRIQGKLVDAFHFLERCVYAFESAFNFEFQPLEDQPDIRMDFGEESEPLNKVFGSCLVKYIDILGRKGCARTALEVCKFLLNLDPMNDPFGVLLRIDFYAIRSKEFEWLKKFTKNFYKERSDKGIFTLLLLPNLLLSQCLA